MDFNVMNELGFTEAEKKVYLCLLPLGSTTAAKVIERTGLQSSVFYRTIHSLVGKGFAGFIKKGKIKYYNASDPEVLLSFLKEKENKALELVPELKKLQSKAVQAESAEVYLGMKGVKTMHYALIEGAKKGEEYFFFGTRADIYPELQEKVYIPYDRRRRALGIKAVGIHNIEVKKVMKKGRYPSMRYVDFPIPQTMAIFRDRVALMAWGEKLENPIGILVTSKEIAEQYKGFFRQMWKLAKP